MKKLNTWSEKHQTTAALCCMILCIIVGYVLCPTRESMLAPNITYNTFNLTMDEKSVWCVEDDEVHIVSNSEEVLLERRCRIQVSLASLNCTSPAFKLIATYEHGLYALSGTCKYEPIQHAWSEYASPWVVFAWIRVFLCILLLLIADLALFVFMTTSLIWCMGRRRTV